MQPFEAALGCINPDVPLEGWQAMNILFKDVNSARSWALFANAQGNQDLLKAAIAYLEKNWDNNVAAMRFYTFLERAEKQS
jgi:hypothetical protein